MSETTVTPNNMPGAQQPGSETPAATTTPPWGADPQAYDADKAGRLIANLRASEDQQKREIATLKAQLAEQQPVIDAAEEVRRREQGELETLRQDLASTRQELSTTKEAAATNLQEALRAKVGELASNRSFINSGTASKLIDLADCLTDGRINEAVIASQLDALAVSDPYLVASAPGGRKPNPAQGQGNGPASAADAQLHAEKAGDVKGALRAAAQQLMEAGGSRPQF